MIRLNRSCPVVVSTTSEITMTEQSGEVEHLVGETEQQSVQENQQLHVGDIPTIPVETETKKSKKRGVCEGNVAQLQNSDMLVYDPAVACHAVKNVVDTLRASTFYQNSRDLLKQVVDCGRTMQQQQQQMELDLKQKEQQRVRAKIQRMCERQQDHDDGLVPSCIITANKNMLEDSTDTAAPCQSPHLPPTLPDYSLIMRGSPSSWEEQQQLNPGLLNLIEQFREKQEPEQQTNFNLNNQQLPSLQNISQHQTPLHMPEEVGSRMDGGVGVNGKDQQRTIDALKKLVTDPDTLNQLGNLRSTITDTLSTFPIPPPLNANSFSPPLFQSQDTAKLKRIRSGKRKAKSENFPGQSSLRDSSSNSLGRTGKQISVDLKSSSGEYKSFSTVPADGFRPVVTQPPKPHNKELRFANLMLHPDVVQIQRQVLQEWKQQGRAVIEPQNVLKGASLNFDRELLPCMVDQLQDLLQINSKEELQSCQLPLRYLNIRDDLVELFKISDDDQRVELRGKLGVRARKNMPAGSVLGILRGFIFKKEAYMSTLRQAEEQGAVSFQLLDYKASQYIHEVDVVDDERLCFVMTQYCYGNLLAEVNDPHIDVFNLEDEQYEQDNWEQQKNAQVAPANADILHFQIAGFPVPVMVATKSITAGEEILCCYGWQYWKLMKTVQNKYQNITNDGQLPMLPET